MTHHGHVPLHLLSLAGFASMAAMRLCDAMLPALGAAFHVGAAETAGVVSAFAIAYGVSQLAYGPLGDRVGKATVVAFATLACGALSLAAALAGNLASLIALRALMGVAAGGIIPLSMATVGDQVPWEDRQAALAQLLTFTVTGMIFGTWAGGAIAQWWGWQWAFGLAAVLLFVAGAALVPHASRRVPAHDAHASSLARFTDVISDRWARSLLAITCIEGALVFGVVVSVPTVLHARFGLSLATSGAVAAAFGLGGLVYSRNARRFIRLGRARLAWAGGVGLCAAWWLLAAMPGWPWAVAACLVGGTSFYMLHATLQSFATELTTTSRGTAMSLFACSLFVGQSVGISAGTALVEAGAAAAYFACSGIGLALLSWVFSSRLRARASVPS